MSEEFRTITVSVSQEDINIGLRNDPMRCPVALALKRAGMSTPYAGTFTLSSADDSRFFPFHAAVRDWIENYDRREGSVHKYEDVPLTFEVKVPIEWLREEVAVS